MPSVSASPGFDSRPMHSQFFGIYLFGGLGLGVEDPDSFVFLDGLGRMEVSAGLGKIWTAWMSLFG